MEIGEALPVSVVIVQKEKECDRLAAEGFPMQDQDLREYGMEMMERETGESLPALAVLVQ